MYLCRGFRAFAGKILRPLRRPEAQFGGVTTGHAADKDKHCRPGHGECAQKETT